MDVQLIINSVFVVACISGLCHLINGFFERRHKQKTDLLLLALEFTKETNHILLETAKLYPQQGVTFLPIEEVTDNHYQRLLKLFKLGK